MDFNIACDHTTLSGSLQTSGFHPACNRSWTNAAMAKPRFSWWATWIERCYVLSRSRPVYCDPFGSHHSRCLECEPPTIQPSNQPTITNLHHDRNNTTVAFDGLLLSSCGCCCWLFVVKITQHRASRFSDPYWPFLMIRPELLRLTSVAKIQVTLSEPQNFACLPWDDLIKNRQKLILSHYLSC